MPPLHLTLAMNPYDRITALVSGEVQPEGIELEYAGPGGPDTYYEQLKFARYDISEMSLSAFLRARAAGWEYVALPVFHNRNFYYTKTLIRLASGIRVGHPGDLRGRRVGVADYLQSAALWTRGILQHEFGVEPQDMEWFQERSMHRSVGGAARFTPPPDITLHYADTDLGSMLQNGELDAAITYLSRSSMDRPKADLSRHADFSLLFPDDEEESIRFYRKHGVYPTHHVTVLREHVMQESPWAPTALIRAFERAKRAAIERLYQRPHLWSLVPFRDEVVARQRDVFGADPHPYGIRANAEVLDMAQTFSVEQGLSPHKQSWAQLFPEELLLAERLASDEGVGQTGDA